jgi:hypothetical protein
MPLKLMKKNKNIKYLFFTGILLYSLSFIATKKTEINPCQLAVDNYLQKDTTVRNYAYMSWQSQDTLLVSADTTNPHTVNWNNVTDSVCLILKNSCAINNKPIFVINNRDTARSTWNNRFGKKIFSTQCP